MTSEKLEVAPIRLIRRRLAVLVSLLLVVFAAGAALVLVRSIDKQVDDVLHTYDVRNKARELTIALTEAESSQRGYMLTRDPSYLEPYRAAADTIGARTQALIAATEDDGVQAERVHSIVGEINTKVAEMARTVELVASERDQEAQNLVQTGMGARLMDSVRQTLGMFIADEDQKLLERNAGIDTYRRLLVGMIILALAGAVVLAYVLLIRTQRRLTSLWESQDQLRSANEILEEHVRSRTVALEEARAHAERERRRVEALLQDTNHRIGNSLATVSSLLGLQLLRSKSDEVRDALDAARARVHAIASAHRRLRLGDDLETASADEFLGAVLDDIGLSAKGERAVTVVGEIEPIVIGARDATTIGILVGELVTNALKHGFPNDRKGVITVSFLNKDGVPTLIVADDGIGMADHASPGESGLGTVIVKQLATQFGGVPHYSGRAEGGLVVTVPLPGIDGASHSHSI
ncbi:hypothetical protein WH87_13935 [Devosia epidermidihirudinis]|uniref:histidine kinase n=1 Tax=Devosia epidermidihirudinis TaxID=1293439 RepID=A0A0F5Q6K3_9HYPH|nr:CHASE3 domain-containing protein [Devosia epidermidihirudinis]KKC36557.1 hypothetical protein WH87_13935 [Devosia epidermidihirudinis]